MSKKNASSKMNSKSKSPDDSSVNANSKKAKSDDSNQEVLIKVGGLEYKTPSRRQRIVIGSIVIGLNLLLVLATVAYFNVPGFQEFIYNIGRN